MDDLIRRQDAIELAMQYCPDDDGSCSKAGADIREMLDELEDLTPAQPERKKRRWIKGINENGVTTSLFCSECNYENKHWYEWNFCPNCGAEMRKGEEE